jgi:hypothetical protein
MQVSGHVATAAAASGWSGSELVGLRIQLVADSAAAIVVLLVALTLSIYKPRGLTSYGWRKQAVGRRTGTETAAAVDHSRSA